MVGRWLLLFCHVLLGERISDKISLDVISQEEDSFLLKRSHGRLNHQKDDTSHELQRQAANDLNAEANPFPQQCLDGAMELSGAYKVTEEVIIQGPCNLTGRGAQLYLSAPIRFQGDVGFFGTFLVEGQEEGHLDGPCMEVNGTWTLFPGANVSFEDCNNGRTVSKVTSGGALGIEGDAELRGGHLLISGSSVSYKKKLSFSSILSKLRKSSMRSMGGAMYVKGTWRQRESTVEIFDCRSRRGGAIFATKFEITAGNLTIYQAIAEHSGGAIWAVSLDIQGGSVSVTSTSGAFGGSIYTNHFLQSAGILSIQQTSAEEKGGAISTHTFQMVGGELSINRSHANGDGGSIVASTFRMSGGGLHISDTHARHKGGAILSPMVKILGGDLRINNALAEQNGGAFRAHRGFHMSGGHVTINEPYALTNGGAIATLKVNLTGGNLVIRSSKAKQSGGAIRAALNLHMTGGNLTIDGSIATTNGGAISVAKAILQGGNLNIASTYADCGGAMWITDLILKGSNVTISDSHARQDAGGVRATAIKILAGSLTIDKSIATQSGGGIKAGKVQLIAGSLSLTRCEAHHHGGAMKTHGFENRLAAVLTIKDSKADRGGCLFIMSKSEIQAPSVHISNCSAGSFGGCVYAAESVRLHGQLSLRHCRADGSGGGLIGMQGITAEQILCDGCDAATGAVLLAETQETVLGEVKIVSRTPAALPSAIVGGPTARVQVSTLDCLKAPGCGVQAQQAKVARLFCQRGEGRQTLANDDGLQCQTCPAGETRLVMLPEAQCTKCPDFDNAIICTATELVLPAGYMVVFNRSTATNLTAWYHCPSEAACRGGHFRAGSTVGEPVQEVKLMCEPGHEGPGCTHCGEGYAQSDSNVLLCVKCSRSRSEVGWYVGFYLIKNFALFASAVISVSGAKGQRMASATLLNQLMSFAAVAGLAMSGAMQTETFKTDLAHWTQEVFRYLSLPVSVAQGQGSNGATVSTACLLDLMGMDKSLPHVHMLLSVWPALLVVGLALARGGWLATVVGANVFLPSFIADFGKYLVAFRLRSENQVLGDIHLDFLPPGPQMTSHLQERIAAVVATIVAVLSLSVASWIYAVRNRSEPLQPHVAYLMQAYRPACSAWEVERLVRKTLLALITAVLPVTLSPALQMESVVLVLTASLVAHLCFWPYQVDSWNRAEVGLLIVAITITGLTTCLIANDLHWGKSAATQRILIILICSLAGGICSIMSIAFLVSYVNDQRRGQHKENDGQA